MNGRITLPVTKRIPSPRSVSLAVLALYVPVGAGCSAAAGGAAPVVPVAVAEAPPCPPLEASNERQRLGPCINTEYDESLPRLSADGGTLFFLRSRSPENVGGAEAGEDVWYVTSTESGGWGGASNVGAPVNNELNNFVVAVLEDGALLVGNAYAPEGDLASGLAIAYRDAAGWQPPRPVTIEGWYSRSRWVSYSLSADGTILLLHAERDDGLGGTDLYVSHRREDGSWSAPINLGGDVNTAANEITPWLADDNRTLYFSSDGRGGFGGYDVFVSQRLDDSWQRWSPPENLGPAVNSPGFDAYFSVPLGSDYAYFASSSGAVGGTDIFRVALAALAPAPDPEPRLVVRGRVLDAETRRPLFAVVRYEAFDDGSATGETGSDPETGAYVLELVPGHVYTLRAEADGYLGVSASVESREPGEAVVDLALVAVRVGASIELRNVYFDFGKADLRTESRIELDRIVRFLMDNPDISIEVQGHTDNVGSDAVNRRLSDARARAIRAYLIARGIEGERVRARGFGSSQPIASNDTDEGRQRNRRVEIKILETRGQP